MTRVLFVYPNKTGYGYTPIGLATLSAVLKKGGHKTDLFDTTFFKIKSQGTIERREEILQFKKVYNKYDEKIEVDIIGELLKKINEFKPDLIAGTCTTDDYEFLLYLIKELKRRYDIPVIIGGTHTTISPEEVINEPSIDMICIGEGEQALLELCNKIEKKRSINNIKNLWIKKDGKIIKNELRPLIEDLDSLPYVDWDIFSDKHHYRAFSGKIYYFGWFEFGRGCPYACNYCVNPYLHKIYKGKGNFYRFKSPKRIINEIKYFKDKYPMKFIRFVDETFLAMPREKIKEFAILYKKYINIPFIMMTRPETINKDIAKILGDLGTCKHISIGIEHGNDRIRKDYLNRNISNEKIISAFKLLEEVGIDTTSYNMIGFPTETRKEIFETIELNRRANPEIALMSFFYPYKGTPLRDICINMKLMKNDAEMVDYGEESILNMPQISREEIHGFRRTFILYIRAPKILYPLIKLCEKENILSNTIYNIFRIYYSLKMNGEV